MKRGATREEIIRTTQELISRNGIRAVRVDEIAQTLGISKRTLYTMFADKNELVNACLDEMGRSIRRRISGYRRLRATSLQKTFRLTNEYIDSLYLVDSCFLNDVKQKLAYAEQYAEHRVVWDKELTSMLESCRKACKLALRDAHQPGIARGAAAHLPGPASGRRHAGGHRPHRPELMLRHTGHSVPGRI